jgi:hypothetical protein
MNMRLTAVWALCVAALVSGCASSKVTEDCAETDIGSTQPMCAATNLSSTAHQNQQHRQRTVNERKTATTDTAPAQH